jgi:FAD synthase
VVTFDPHPQEFFTGQPKKLLTPLAEKVELLEAMGVEQLVLLPFDRELATLTARVCRGNSGATTKSESN